MRQYQPIWEALKKGGVCIITAPAPLHRRIIKAVIKEKYNDLGYKLELAENNKRAKIVYTKKHSMIEFKLIKSIGTDDL